MLFEKHEDQRALRVKSLLTLARNCMLTGECSSTGCACRHQRAVPRDCLTKYCHMTIHVSCCRKAPEGRNKSYSLKSNVGFLSFKEDFKPTYTRLRFFRKREGKKATRMSLRRLGCVSELAFNSGVIERQKSNVMFRSSRFFLPSGADMLISSWSQVDLDGCLISGE